jgi:hypothetical protein
MEPENLIWIKPISLVPESETGNTHKKSKQVEDQIK